MDPCHLLPYSCCTLYHASHLPGSSVLHTSILSISTLRPFILRSLLPRKFFLQHFFSCLTSQATSLESNSLTIIPNIYTHHTTLGGYWFTIVQLIILQYYQGTKTTRVQQKLFLEFWFYPKATWESVILPIRCKIIRMNSRHCSVFVQLSCKAL